MGGVIAVGEVQSKGVNAVLDAAALTYVAALATAVLQVLYYVLMLAGLGRRVPKELARDRETDQDERAHGGRRHQASVGAQ